MNQENAKNTEKNRAKDKLIQRFMIFLDHR